MGMTQTSKSRAGEDLQGALRRTAEIESLGVTDPFLHARLVDQLITEYGVADETGPVSPVIAIESARKVTIAT